MMKIFTAAVIFCIIDLCGIKAFAQTVNTNNMKVDIGNKAFSAWQTGEKTGNYNDFKTMISTSFKLFSHPLLGKFKNINALEKMLSLIAEREVKKII